MRHERRITSIQAWLLSGILTAICAAVVFLVFAFIFDDYSGDEKAIFYVLGIYEAVHLVSHLVVGLPFFLHFWSRIDNSVWRIQFSLPIGFLLGYMAMFLFFYIFSGFEVGWIDKGALFGCLLGGLYGLVTAAIAWAVSYWANKMLR